MNLVPTLAQTGAISINESVSQRTKYDQSQGRISDGQNSSLFLSVMTDRIQKFYFFRTFLFAVQLVYPLWT